MKTFDSIPEYDLETVAGGKHNNPPHDMNNMGSGSNNDQLMTTLHSIQSSLKDLGKNNNNGLVGGNNMTLFVAMAFALRRNQVVVYNNRGYSW